MYRYQSAILRLYSLRNILISTKLFFPLCFAYQNCRTMDYNLLFTKIKKKKRSLYDILNHVFFNIYNTLLKYKNYCNLNHINASFEQNNIFLKNILFYENNQLFLPNLLDYPIHYKIKCNINIHKLYYSNKFR
jgi:hypothetical protein